MPAAAPRRSGAAACAPAARGRECTIGIRSVRLPRLPRRPRQTPHVSSRNTSWANPVSVPRLLMPQAAADGASAASTAQGRLGIGSVTTRAEGQIPASGGSRTSDAGVQVELQELEEAAEKESTGQSSGNLCSASLASSVEADTVCAASLLAAQPGPGGHLESLAVTGTEDGENSTSSNTECSSASDDSPARDVLVQDLQQELEESAGREISGQLSGTLQAASLVPSKAHTVCSRSPLRFGPGLAELLEPLPASVPEDTESSYSEVAWSAVDSNATILFLSVSQRGGSSEGLATVTPNSSAEALGEAERSEDPRVINWQARGYPMIPVRWRILDEDGNEHIMSRWNISWPKSLRSCGQQSLQARDNASNTAGAAQDVPDTQPTTSWADGWFLDSADSRMWAIRWPVEQEESSNDSSSATAESKQDSRDTAETDGGVHLPSCLCPSTSEAVEEDWECDSDAASEAVSVTLGTSDNSSAEVEDTSSATSVAADPRPEEQVSACVGSDVGPQHEVSKACVVGTRHEIGDFQLLAGRLPLVQEDSSDDSSSSSSTAESMLNTRDTAETDEGIHLPSRLCTSKVDAVEEDWDYYSEEDTSSEAVSLTPSTSDNSSVDVETTSSASSVAADPRPEEQVSACVGADVGPQDEVSAEARKRAQSSVCFRDAPEDGPGTTDAPHAAARRRMPAVIRMALRALRRVCTCSCIRGQEEERHEAANTRQLPETTN